MKYKYQKGQIFGKKLKVPENILNNVYYCTLFWGEFIKYDLADKIPTSCLIEEDRKIVERFGIEKSKKLDWELLNSYIIEVKPKSLILTIDPQTSDVNAALYELLKDKINPSDYPPPMKAAYSERLFEISEDDEHKTIKEKFNSGRASVKDLIRNWNLFENKDISYCLQEDKSNESSITSSQLREFMDKYGTLAQLLLDVTDIYQFINDINNLESEEEKKAYIKPISDSVLEKTITDSTHHASIILEDEEYRTLFQYSSLKDYLKRVNIIRHDSIDTIFKELETLPKDYIFNTHIPIEVLKNSDVLYFLGTYGLKNVVDFDNECGHFFTKDNCEMLKLMDKMYLSYAENVRDPNKSILTKNAYDENGNYVKRLYTKDEFYEAMRRMIIYGPSNGEYMDKAPNYREMTGEFRVRNKELFISDEAPQELQQLFYTKSITPNLLREHPEYIEYLKEKDLSSCFKKRDIYVDESRSYSGIENFYKFLGTKTDFNGLINFVVEYAEILDFVIDREPNKSYSDEIIFSWEDDINQIKQKISESFRNLIIKKGKPYPKNIPEDLLEKYPTMFLKSDAPQELQEAFYNRTITPEFILANPTFKEYLKNVDLEVIFKYMPVREVNEKYKDQQINITSAIQKTFGDESLDIMLAYGKYIESAFATDGLKDFKFDPNASKDEVLDELDKAILQTIIDGNIRYDENISSHFKKNNPTLFLNPNVPKDIRDKFYNREFTLIDFNTNPELIEMFGDTNIVCGFPENLSWMIPLFNDLDNIKIANYNRLKVISTYLKIQDVALQYAFKEYVMESIKDIDIEKIEYISEVLSSLSLSNSSEIFTFRKELSTQILNSDNPLDSLSKIEDVFIRNNIPTVGKIYSCFEILHPDFQGFNFNSSKVSPVLKKSSTASKKIIIFSDLIKSSFGSNNRSINAYLQNIDIGSKLYERLKSGQIQYDKLSETDQKELETFSKHLATLYNNTMKAKKANETFTPSGNTLEDILDLSKKLSPDGSLDYNLGDRVIRMFCGLTGIDTLEQAKEYVSKKIHTADSRNREASNKDMVLETGDFLKGIGNINYLRNILQNGSVSKEYLGSSATSDATPLDTDVSIISSEGTIKDKIEKTAASSYGPIWFVLKNDDRFITTRNSSETFDTKRDLSKMEVFYTGVLGQNHYGIRTGFASSEINYIVMENYDPKVGLEIAMNGFYIPIANKEGKIIFTPNDYDNLREKMNGLSYYGEDNYKFSDNLVNEETEYFASQIDKSNYDTEVKRTKINEIIKKSLNELGLHLKTEIDGDLTEGYVELIDTGSTGRGTNKPGDGDFDFMMRLDRTLLSNPQKLNQLKAVILKNLGRTDSSGVIGTGDFRLKNVQIDDETNVDIDITFTEKTDKVSYSTDMALRDRLATIQKIDPEKYRYVVANILLAKQVLKKAQAYKPNRGEIPQGGLGGVGIENWILQNGGSFIDAARSFVEASHCKSFQEFKENYQIWDFGENHLAERRGKYSHDNFVANNMSEVGYQKMTQALEEYLKSLENKKFQTEELNSLY